MHYDIRHITFDVCQLAGTKDRVDLDEIVPCILVSGAARARLAKAVVATVVFCDCGSDGDHTARCCAARRNSHYANWPNSAMFSEVKPALCKRCFARIVFRAILKPQKLESLNKLRIAKPPCEICDSTRHQDARYRNQVNSNVLELTY